MELKEFLLLIISFLYSKKNLDKKVWRGFIGCWIVSLFVAIGYIMDAGYAEKFGLPLLVAR